MRRDPRRRVSNGIGETKMMKTTLVTVFRRGPLAITWMFVVVLGVTVVHTEQRQPGHSRSIHAALVQNGIGPGSLRSDVIVSWNILAHDLAFAEDQFLTFKGQRALAMMHLAMHDALNAIVPIYEAYAFSGGPRLAHPIAASA